MITSLLFLTLGTASITFESKAARVPIILERLPPLMGRKLNCDGQFANEVLVLSVKDVKPGELLDQIARVNTAIWEKKDDTLVLRPDAARRTEQEVRRMADRKAQVQLMLDAYKKELDASYDGKIPTRQEVNSPYGWDQDRAQRKSPPNRFMMRLLLGLGADRLAKIERGERAVFALNPNKLQTPLPTGWQSAADLLREEIATLRRTAPNETRVGTWSFSQGTELLDQKAPPRALWLSVKDILGGYDNVHFGLIDGAGNGLGDTLRKSITPIERPKGDPALTGTLTYEKDSQELSKMISTVFNAGHPTIRGSDPLAKKVLEPDFEPLSIGSELFIQFAAQKKENLVALINDNALQYYGSQVSPLKTSSFDELLGLFSNREESGGWLLLTPSQPADARRSRDDRKVVRQLMIDAQDGHLDLGRKCEYVAKRPYGIPVGLGIRMAAFFDSELPSYGYEVWESAMRIYGLLTPEQRKHSGIEYQALSEPLRREINRGIYNDNRINRSSKAPYDPNFDRIPTETTFLVPGGVPVESVLYTTIAPVERDIRVSSTTSQLSWFGGANIPTIATMIFFEQNPSLVEPGATMGKKPDRFEPLEKVTAFIKVDMGAFESNYNLRDQAALSGPVPLEKLPAEFAKMIQAEIDRMNKEKEAGNPPRLKQNPNQTRGNPPPASS